PAVEGGIERDGGAILSLRLAQPSQLAQRPAEVAVPLSVAGVDAHGLARRRLGLRPLFLHEQDPREVTRQPSKPGLNRAASRAAASASAQRCWPPSTWPSRPCQSASL